MAKRRTLMSNLVPVSDDEWMAALKRDRPWAIQALERLVKKGCTRSFVVACLRVIECANLKGLKRKDIERATQEFQAAARWIGEIEASDLGFKLREQVPGGLTDLEVGLRALIRAAEQNISLADRRGARTRDDCLAALVRHVHRKVGQFRDAEVSSLVGTTEQAHSKWRKRHREALKRTTVFEREWRARAKADRWQVLWEGVQPKSESHFVLHLVRDAEDGAEDDDLKET